MRLPASLVLVVALALAPAAFADVPPILSHRDHSRAGFAAFQRKDFAAATTAFDAALKLRPDSPRYRYNFAAACALSGRTADALQALQAFAALGVDLPVATDEDFAALRESPEFQQLVRQIAGHRAPRGQAVESFALPAMTGIIEGLAFRESTGDFFLGDVHHRCVWRRDRTGRVTRFSPPGDVLFGVFKIALDEPRQLLWLATSMLPEAAGFTAAHEGAAAFVALHLADGRIAHTHPLPADGRGHVLGDLLPAADGTLYATDSLAPVVWRLRPGNAAPEVFVESPRFVSLQGLTLVAQGKKLLVADYSNGLVAIDLADRSLHPLAPPADTTLLGIDGLASLDDAVLAIQNGVEPQRALRLTLLPAGDVVTRVETLAAALPQFDDLSLPALVQGRPCVIAQSGWALANPAKSPAIAPHTVRIFDLGR